MTKLEGTDLFYLTRSLERQSRFEYKFVADSTWILDPINPRRTVGGYGLNSEVWMLGYVPPEEIQERADVSRGRIDTLLFRSDTLGRTHPVMVYLPSGYTKEKGNYETIWVTDGGEYLSLGLMKTVLDNLIHERRIRPVVAVFVDPRTDPRDSGTSKRMEDYTMSVKFLNALVTELRPRLLKEYQIRNTPAVIMGASLGGLFATFATFARPDVFGASASQSPAFWWNNRAIFDFVRAIQPNAVNFYIDTGTINDAQPDALAMKNVLVELGYPVSYAEYPEGHNWVNWRARIDEILEYFFRVSE
jgi:enterochelin esterase family protein